MLVAATAVGGRLAGIDAFDLVLQAGVVVKLVLVLLLVFSIVSWALIVQKWRELKRAGQDSEVFLRVYHEGSPDAAYDAARSAGRSPLAAVFVAGYGEVNRMLKHAGARGAVELSPVQVRALSQHVAWAASREALRLERGLPFLATTGSASPFIGLFGTVVGIINAFEGIGRAGSASLAVVAPGIAEALIATAVGLFAAIPATIFYNHFLGEIRQLTAALDLFVADLDADLPRIAGAGEPRARAAGG